MKEWGKYLLDEFLLQVIKNKGDCLNETIDVGYWNSCITCPLNTKDENLQGACRPTKHYPRKSLTKQERYELAVKRFVDEFGTERLVEEFI